MPDHFYVYPSYLKRSVPRSGGRRVPAAVSVPGELTAERLGEVAKALGFHAEIETKQYPKEAWRGEGRLKVKKTKGVTKAQFLLRLSKELRDRAQAEAAARSGGAR